MSQTIEPLIPLIPLLPLAGAMLNGLVGHRLPRPVVSTLACGTVFVSFVIACYAAVLMWQAEGAIRFSSTLYTWIQSGNLNIDVTFTIDRLSGVMILVITGVGFLIHVYSIGYMAHEPALARYFAYLNLFTFAMLVLVLGNSLPLMFVGWEGVGLCSYLLIGFWYTDSQKAKAGKKAFVVNRIGDFGFIIAMLLLFRFAGTLHFDGIRAAAGAGTISAGLATGVCLMLLLGAAGKSAQLPLFVWLPDAMAGPTPVSALIHAATMVTAGVYLVVRLGFLYNLAPIAMLTVATMGALTALFAATIATAQNDIKKVLAYSTVSQLGFMFIAAGVGAYAIAIFHLVTHAFFKACLFLGSGSVIHGMSGEQDIRQMGGLRKQMKITYWTFVAATMAITGFPLTAGFMSKDAILWNALAAGHGVYADVFGVWAKLIWFTGAIAALLTSFYMWRLVFLTFHSGELRARDDVKAGMSAIHESPFSMTLPLIILGALSLIGGLVLGVAAPIAHLFHLPSEWIVDWLRPSVGASPVAAVHAVGLEWGLMGTSVLIFFVGLFSAGVLYFNRIHPFAKTFASERPWRWLYVRLINKWHVDELYEATLIRPIHWGSKVLLYEGLDKRIIDGTVNLVGWFVRSIGYLGQVFHTGNIQRYIAIFAIALAIMLYGWLTPSWRGTDTTPNEKAATEDRVPHRVALQGDTGRGR
ncbi:MAG: NADH-quinone oxidoreductase subunit L [Myxococcota bacterium]